MDHWKTPAQLALRVAANIMALQAIQGQPITPGAVEALESLAARHPDDAPLVIAVRQFQRTWAQHRRDPDRLYLAGQVLFDALSHPDPAQPLAVERVA